MEDKYENLIFKGSQIRISTDLIAERIGLITDVTPETFFFKELINELSVNDDGVGPEYLYHVIHKKKIIKITKHPRSINNP